MKPRIDFQICEVLPGGQVTGRNCGSDVPVGQIFTALYFRDFPASIGEEHATPSPEFGSEICLRLESIELYRRHVNLLAKGYTALFSLSGSGFETLAQLVSTAPDRRYYSLCAFDEAFRSAPTTTC
jgi:hypothetical protein